MRQFEGFQRQAVVVVVADDVQSTREKQRHQADGKDIPDSAILEMKGTVPIFIYLYFILQYFIHNNNLVKLATKTLSKPLFHLNSMKYF